ncbi:MAG: hypothetical protein ACM37W_28790 [Actinomycetota bacterium]
MKIIHLQSTVSEVEISSTEINIILCSLMVIVEKIPLWEFQTIMGYYIEEVQSLIDKLHTITVNNQSIESHNFSLSLDELIIIKGALRECGYAARNKSLEKEVFQNLLELIGQMKNKD